MQSSFIASFMILDNHVMVNWCLSTQGIHWPSCDYIASSSLGLIEVTFFFTISWLLTKYWFSIGLWAHVRLTYCKQGWVIQMLVSVESSVHQIINFSSIQMLSTFVLHILRLFKLKTEGQTTHRKPHRKVYKTQNSCLYWVSLIRFWINQPKISTFRLG